MTAEIFGRKIGSVGYGLAGLTRRHGGPPEELCFDAMHAALSAGCNLWDGGEFYGTPESNSLTLLKKYFTRYPEDAEKVVLNVKGALKSDMSPDGSPSFVRQSVDRCLEMLGGKGRIDMFECARRDPNTPLEITIVTLEDLMKEGKIGGVALSEVNANTIREAAKITRVLAVEVEISLFSTEPLYNGITQACGELNIPILAYCPIGRGMLSGHIKSFDDIPEKDMRKNLPRFQPPNFENNMILVKKLENLAQRRNCTSAQLALAWLISLSKKNGMPKIIPIPGATTIGHAIENAKAGEIELKEEEMEEIDQVLATCVVAGDRYHQLGMRNLNG